MKILPIITPIITPIFFFISCSHKNELICKLDILYIVYNGKTQLRSFYTNIE